MSPVAAHAGLPLQSPLKLRVCTGLEQGQREDFLFGQHRDLWTGGPNRDHAFDSCFAFAQPWSHIRATKLRCALLFDV